MERIIFHVDVNNAFLSWTAIHRLKSGESLDIRKIPAIIAGDEKSRHGIVLAKSPIAKKMGIKTAETIYSAKKKCPTLKIYPPEFDWYYEQSNKMYAYLQQYTPLIERFSIDECFMDFTGTNLLYDNYEKLAYKIKEDIKNELGFTVNVGIGNNKLCAKMASDFEKPDKVHTLYNKEIETKMWPLPIEDLFMVGKKTSSLLKNLNINTIGALANTKDSILIRHFKNQASFLKNSAWGIDDSKVMPRSSKSESISISETLPHDYDDYDELKKVLFRQTEEVTRALRSQGEYARTVAITYKNNFFESYSHQMKLDPPQNSTTAIYGEVLKLLKNSWKEDSIRNIGIRLSDLTKNKNSQLSLFEEKQIENKSNDDIQDTIDFINKKYGSTSIIPASIKIIGKSTKHQKPKQ